MRSLRRRLVWSLATVLTLVWIAGGIATYKLTERELALELDRTLLRELTHTLPQIAIEFFSSDRRNRPPTGNASLHSAHVQVWTLDGKTVVRSPPLGDGSLVWPELPTRVTTLAKLATADVSYTDLRLPDDTPARAIAACVEIPKPLDRHFTPQSTATIPLNVLLARTRETIERPLSVLAWLFVAVSALSLGMLAWTSRWLVHRELYPLDVLGQQIAELNPEQLQKRIDMQDVPREIVPVRDALNSLLGRIEAAFRREKEFAANAAHELNTPLAALRATIEVALQDDATPCAIPSCPAADHVEALQTGHTLTLQMIQTVRSLLDLVRAQTTKRCAVDVLQLATQAAALHPTGSVRIANTPVIAWADPELLNRVLHNLIDNALSYGADGVDVSFETTAANVIVTVSNRADGISPEFATRAFDTFWRGNAARHDNHVGLGLSLCRSIVTAMDGDIALHVHQAGEREHRVDITVTLPATNSALT